jgi:hypothetical protein
VWLSESHSDADALCAAGIVGTTNWLAAGHWNMEDAAQLRGKRVIVVMHRDEAGREFALAVTRSLGYRGVKVVRARKGNDARDHLEAGLGLSDFVPVLPWQLRKEAA